MRLAIAMTILLAGCSTGPTRDSTVPTTLPTTTRAIRKVELQGLAVWRYDPDADQWTKVDRDIMRQVLFTSKPGASHVGSTSATSRPTAPIGLYWAGWTQDGIARGAFIFNGPVKCNDLDIGHAPDGKVPACVPSQNSAEARFVPDPRINCK